ncbi:hypothetical protein FGIG_08787 [Fasciola gigantica]|uniref:U1-type domain-containing protein n=1 Tax=Fasciola gigantica TaxID=46835 RepID=A0A504YFP8_FASGI|nr:hypothetical protein FGIG_08787 [Fasciola gigantica]
MASPSFCECCGVYCDTELQLENHKKGRKHRAKCLSSTTNVLSSPNLEVALPKQTTPENSVSDLNEFSPMINNSGCLQSFLVTDSPVPGDFYCKTCKILSNSAQQYEQHISGQKHLKKVKSEGSSSSISTGDVSVSDRSPPVLSVDSVTKMIERLRKPSVEAPSSHRAFDRVTRRVVRCCRPFLSEIWPGATFSPGEAFTLIAASETEDDFVLRLGENADSYFRVGIHLVVALLEGNRQAYLPASQSSPCGLSFDREDVGMCAPAAIWIVPKVSQGPDPSLFTYVRFQNPHGPNYSDVSLRLVTPTGGGVLNLDFDVLLTDPHYFVENFNSIVQSRFLCCFIIQDIQSVSECVEFCGAMNGYIQQTTPSYRARIICFSKDRVRLNPPFTKFRELSGV